MRAEVSHPRDEEPGELITGALHDVRDLAVAEVDKLKAEARQVGETAKIAGVGGAILLAAAIMLAHALARGLVALGAPDWAAYGVIALVLGTAGALFIKKPRRVAAAT